MVGYRISLCIVFLLLPGCLEMQYSDALWAPKVAPTMYGEHPAMRNITYWCNNAYYKGFSPKNLDARMSSHCEPLEDGNMICAMEARDEHTYWTTESVYDSKKNEWHTKHVERTDHYTYMLNIYINAQGLVYDCKGERGDFSIFTTKKPQEGSLASKLPK